jgi:hypothetical protein
MGAYTGAAPLDDKRILAARIDGVAEVLRLPELKVERELCISGESCLPKVLGATQRAGLPKLGELQGMKASRSVIQQLVDRRPELVASPSRKYVLMVDIPDRMRDMRGPEPEPVRLSVYDARSLKRLATTSPPEACDAMSPHFQFEFTRLLLKPQFLDDERVLLCGRPHVVRTLKPLPATTAKKASEFAGPSSSLTFAQTAIGAGWRVLVKSELSIRDYSYDSIELLKNNTERLGQLAGGTLPLPSFSEKKALPAPYVRTQMRYNTIAQTSPDGQRLLLTSPGLYPEPAGAAQLYCLPGRPLPSSMAAPLPPE